VLTIDFNRIRESNAGGLNGSRILDIGCGSGRHACEAYRFKDVTVIAADLNYHDVAEAKKRLVFHDRLGEHGGGLWGLSVADITHLPFRDNFFDLVICSEVLEHIPDHETAARELLRVLKSGSPLAVSVPRYYPERLCWALSDDYHKVNQGHIRIYKRRALRKLIEKSGAKQWAAHYAHSLHTPYWWLKCLIGPTRNDALSVNLYHRFLTWDIMKKPFITRQLDFLLNPILGKSVVLYFNKVSP